MDFLWGHHPNTPNISLDILETRLKIKLKISFIFFYTLPNAKGIMLQFLAGFLFEQFPNIILHPEHNVSICLKCVGY